MTLRSLLLGIGDYVEAMTPMTIFYNDVAFTRRRLTARERKIE